MLAVSRTRKRVVSAIDWEQAGRGWGARARDWAYLFEHYARPANEIVFDRVGVGSDTRLLDIACGSGLAAQTAHRRGATVTGLDASEALIEIARRRTPSSDFRVGDMFALPFADHSFDVVTTFNGIWKGCEGALEEARRALIDGGRFGMTFWGDFARLGLMPYFLKIIELSPSSHQAATTEQGGTSSAIENMLAATGFRIDEIGTVEVVNEWPDVALAVRAMAAAGPAVPAIDAVGYDAFCAALTEVISPLDDPEVGVRISSELGWLTATPIRP